MSKPERTFHNLIQDDLKTNIVKMSKLLSEVWLNKEEGIKFKNVVFGRAPCSYPKNGDIVKEALAECGIDFPEKYVRFQLDSSSFNGDITIEEDLSQGLAFLWHLPFAPKPANGIEDQEIEEWISQCDQWLNATPQPDTLPKPNNIYIPLATF